MNDQLNWKKVRKFFLNIEKTKFIISSLSVKYFLKTTKNKEKNISYSRIFLE